MKAKLTTAIASMVVALSAQCATVTNTVTIVSNIYNRISREYYITNNIVHDINYNYNDYSTNTTVKYDVSQEAIAEARAQAQSATNSALAASNSASSAAGSASSAAGSASSAASQYSRVVGAANSGVSSINSATQSGIDSISSTGNSMLTSIRNEKSWFDEHFGKMVTNVEITVTTNIYHVEDSIARAGVAQNAADIASLEERVGDNIQQLTIRMGTAETNIGNLNTSVSNSFAYTTAVSNRLERGVTEAIRGVQNSIEYTTGVSNKFEKMNRIYNDGTGYSMWMDKRPIVQTLKIYRSGYLLVTVTFDPTKYIEDSSSYIYTDFTRTPTSLAPLNPSEFRLYKSKSNYRFFIQDEYHQTSSYNMSYIVYWNTGVSNPENVGSGNGTSGTSGITGTSSKEEFEQTPYHVMSDLTIRKIDNTIIAKLATSMALNAISNWVEQTFQRK